MNATKEQTGSLPPRDRTERVKFKLREITGEEGEQTQGKGEKRGTAELQQEKERGEARLREVVERGDVNKSFLQHLGAYLACEPWRALALLEANKPTYQDYLETEKGLAKRHGGEVADVEHRQKKTGFAEEYAINQISEIMLARALEQHDLAQKYAKELDSSIPKDNYFGTSVRGGVPPFGTDCHFPHKARLKGHAQPYEQRSDYWTMAREIIRADPKAYGFTNKKEVDLLLGQRIEEIGRTFGRRFWLEDGIARVERIGLKKPEVEALEIQDAQGIIENNREAKRVAERREQKFLKDMREMLEQLRKLNAAIDAHSMALEKRANRSFFAQLLERISKKTPDTGADSVNIRELETQRQGLVHMLGARNNEVWPGGNNVFKYRLRFNAPEGYKGYRGTVAGNREVHLWTAIAEEDELRMVDEFTNE